PLHRCPTQQSVLSWWSDSNPLGATIPLHTFAKPLMKLLYHQQASAFLAQDDGFSLSKERVELLTTYIGCKYVSVATKQKVLRHFAVRAESILDARAIVDGGGISAEILLSQDSRILREAGSMLAHLCSHDALIPSVVALKPILPLVLMLRSTDETVRQYAILSLCHLLHVSHVSAKDAVAAGILDYTTTLLNDRCSAIVAWSCRMLGRLLRYQDLKDAVIELKPCIELVSLLNHSAPEVRYNAIYVLSRISEWSEASVVDANILAHVKGLLESEDPYVVSCTSCLLGNLERSMPGVINEEFQSQLQCLLAFVAESENVQMCLSTAYALGYWGIETRGNFGMVPGL
ncbi:armadillo-type protein, partial [Mycena polygramma]